MNFDILLTFEKVIFNLIFDEMMGPKIFNHLYSIQWNDFWQSEWFPNKEHATQTENMLGQTKAIWINTN